MTFVRYSVQILQNGAQDLLLETHGMRDVPPDQDLRRNKTSHQRQGLFPIGKKSRTNLSTSTVERYKSQST